MDARNSGTATATDLELVIDRVFDAPRDLVWTMWTERMGEWSAPKGFTMPVSEGDLRPGGAWRACMIKPDGKELWLGGVYKEIVAPERLVFTHAWDGPDGKPGPETLVTVTLKERGGKTEMHFVQSGFDSAESRNGHDEGWTECFDILDEILAKG
jgi:uncharacterized protein YndB with AHSA1/START domain